MEFLIENPNIINHWLIQHTKYIAKHFDEGNIEKVLDSLSAKASAMHQILEKNTSLKLTTPKEKKELLALINKEQTIQPKF